MGHAELGKSQEKMSPDWEQAFNRFESVIASGTEATRLEVIAKLAHLSKRAPEYVLARSIPILARLLEEDSLDNSRCVQEVAAYCLYHIACRGEGELAMEIGLSGVITSLVRLLPHSDDSFRRVLIKSLWSLVTFGIENRVVVARNGGLEIIIDLLNSSTDAVSSGSMVSRERACQAIGLIGVTRRARRVLANLGVIPVLVELFRDGDTRTKLVAGNSLGVISAHIDYIRPVAEAGAIPLYAELFQGSELSGKEIAEDAFCILAVDEGNAVVIAEHLVRILREGDDEARAAAADVLWDLSGYKHSVSVVLLSGAIPILVDLLSNENHEVKEKVSGAIAQLSYDEANRVALADAGAIPFLMELLHDESEESRDNAAEALVNFSDDPLQHNRMSEAMQVPSFQNMQNRLTHIRASENYLARSTRRMSIEQLIQNPDLV
ncbi:Armadillo-type fold containing protein [Trema orientale]|uniref:Armadillo-type fold containing protein n=1 Tax=Trema orientale TaxID=63057 RepID=A0A2P5F8H5_TREOI|nr:Armadillo-type fold containing protein [Trema orientale]